MGFRVSEALPFIEIYHFFHLFFLIGLATSKVLSQFYIVCTHRLPLRRPQQPLPIRLRFLIWQQKIISRFRKFVLCFLFVWVPLIHWRDLLRIGNWKFVISHAFSQEFDPGSLSPQFNFLKLQNWFFFRFYRARDNIDGLPLFEQDL